MRYQVYYTYHRQAAVYDSEIFRDHERGVFTALKLAENPLIKTVTLCADQEGADHSDNAGKFFLERIYK